MAPSCCLSAAFVRLCYKRTHLKPDRLFSRKDIVSAAYRAATYLASSEHRLQQHWLKIKQLYLNKNTLGFTQANIFFFVFGAVSRSLLEFWQHRSLEIETLSHTFANVNKHNLIVKFYRNIHFRSSVYKVGILSFRPHLERKIKYKHIDMQYYHQLLLHC